MTLATRTVTLPGGLQATWSISRRRIVRLPWRGSPPAATTNRRASWLAHLLEHLLFYGGERYQDDDRLMGWVQRQGGSVNATTWLAIARSFRGCRRCSG